MVEASPRHVYLVLERLEREFGRQNVYGNVRIAREDVTLDKVCLFVLQEATQPQLDDPQLLVACGLSVFQALGWEEWAKPEGFRRQFERVQNTQGLYAPSLEGRAMRKAKQSFVEGKNERYRR